MTILSLLRGFYVDNNKNKEIPPGIVEAERPTLQEHLTRQDSVDQPGLHYHLTSSDTEGQRN